jgi:hypothetical protein
VGGGGVTESARIGDALARSTVGVAGSAVNEDCRVRGPARDGLCSMSGPREGRNILETMVWRDGAQGF